MQAHLIKNGYGRFGNRTYEKLKEQGFSAIDFSMMETESGLYVLSQSESDVRLKGERELAEKAGTDIFQVHGPWRWPPQDLFEEDRKERIEKNGIFNTCGVSSWCKKLGYAPAYAVRDSRY